MSAELRCREMINHDEYPIDELENKKRRQVLEKVRRELKQDGCAVINNFFNYAGLDALLKEAKEQSEYAYFSPRKKCNVYLGEGDPQMPEDYPQNIFMERTNGFVTADLFDEGSATRRLYFWGPLKSFLAECLEKTELFIYDDPISNVIVNVCKPGQQFCWHYDTNEFTITMLLQAAESGGEFEYIPNLRTPESECTEGVIKVLQGDRNRVKQLKLKAGDLQFFLGRFSLHRVTENTGNIDRLLLIQSFAEKPGMIGSMYRVQDLYGKISKIHKVHEHDKNRTDELLD